MTALEMNREFDALSSERQRYVFGFFCAALGAHMNDTDLQAAQWARERLQDALLRHPRWDWQWTSRKDGMRVYDRQHPSGRPTVVMEWWINADAAARDEQMLGLVKKWMSEADDREISLEYWRKVKAKTETQKDPILPDEVLSGQQVPPYPTRKYEA